MPQLTFAPGRQYKLHGQVYIIREVLLESKLRVENQTFGGQAVVTVDELIKAWSEGELRFALRGPNLVKDPNAPIATRYTIADFKTLPEHQRNEAWRRYGIVQTILDLPPYERTKQKLEEYAEKLAAAANISTAGTRKRGRIGQAVSRASMERWVKAYVESGYDIRSLVPATQASGGKGSSRLPIEVEDIVQEVLEECWKHPKLRTLDYVHMMIINRIGLENTGRAPSAKLKPPVLTTVHARIRALGDKNILQRRQSRLEAQADKAVGKNPDKPDHVLQRVEIDHTTLHVFIVDIKRRLPIGRPTLTFALDVFSGMPYGIYVGFDGESYLAVESCLENGILPKLDVQKVYGTKNPWPVCGLMDELVVDNGKEFIGLDLKIAAQHLDFKVKPMPVRSPWFKGAVERFFRTNNTGLVHLLPGSTLSNFMQLGDYDPQKDACMTLEAFLKALHVFLLDVYAANMHRGRKRVPAKLWAEHTGPGTGWQPRLPANIADVKILLGRSKTRTVPRDGIELWTLRYKVDKTGRYERMRFILLREAKKSGKTVKVQIKFDPRDISHIYVLDTTQNTGPEWIRVDAVDQEYTKGLYLKAHTQIKAHVLANGDKVDIYALAAAKKHIQDIVAEELSLTRTQKRQNKAGLVFQQSTGQGSQTPHTTAAIKAQDAARSESQKGFSATSEATVQSLESIIEAADAPVPVAAKATKAAAPVQRPPKRPRGRPSKATAAAATAAAAELVVAPSDLDDDELDLTEFGSAYEDD